METRWPIIEHLAFSTAWIGKPGKDADQPQPAAAHQHTRLTSGGSWLPW